MDICPKCGCPIEKVVETETAPQQVEVTGVKITKKSKKIIAIATIAVIAAARSQPLEYRHIRRMWQRRQQQRLRSRARNMGQI